MAVSWKWEWASALQTQPCTAGCSAAGCCPGLTGDRIRLLKMKAKWLKGRNMPAEAAVSWRWASGAFEWGGGGIAISWGVAAAIGTGLWAHGGGGGFPCSSLGSPAPPGFPQHSSHFYNTRKEHDLNTALHSVLEWQGGKGNRGSKQHWEGWMCSRVTCSQSGFGAAQLCIQIGWLVSCRHSR